MAEPITLLPSFDGELSLAQFRQVARDILEEYIRAVLDVTPDMRREFAAEMILHDRMLGLHFQVANLPDGAEDMLLELLKRCAEVFGELEALDDAETALTIH